MRRIFYSKEGSRTIGAFLDNADSKVKKKFRFLLGLMRDDKMVLCEPYVKHFGIEKYKRLYELRMKAGGLSTANAITGTSFSCMPSIKRINAIRKKRSTMR